MEGKNPPSYDEALLSKYDIIANKIGNIQSQPGTSQSPQTISQLEASTEQIQICSTQPVHLFYTKSSRTFHTPTPKHVHKQPSKVNIMLTFKNVSLFFNYHTNFYYII